MKVCFTGHRPNKLCGYENALYQNFVHDLAAYLKTIVERAGGPVEFISGGAQGMDQLAFWAVDVLKRSMNPPYPVTNVVYVPFKGQERAWKETGLFSQKEYRLMLSRADDVVYLKPELTDRSAVVRALMERNHRMADDSDIVIGLYNGNDWDIAKGGTAECLRYAKRHDKALRLIRFKTTDKGLIGSFPVEPD